MHHPATGARQLHVPILSAPAYTRHQAVPQRASTLTGRPSQQSPARHHARRGFAMQYDEGGSTGQRRAECDERRNGEGWEKERIRMKEETEGDERRKPAPCPNYLHYRRTSDAVRCISACSVLQTATQCTASGTAAHCVFLPETLPLPRHAAWPHSSRPSTTEASRLWTCMPVPGGFRWN